MSITIHAAATGLLLATATSSVAQDTARQGNAVPPQNEQQTEPGYAAMAAPPTLGNLALRDIVEAYAKAPGLEERMRIEVVLPADPTDPEAERDRDQMAYRIVHGEGRDVLIDLVDYEVVGLNGHMHVVLGENTKYLKTPVEGNLIDTFRTAFGTDYFFPLSLYARHQVSQDKWLHGLTMGFLSEPVITGFRTDAGEAGNLMEFTIAAKQGSATVLVHPQTQLLSKSVVRFVPEGAPPEFLVDIEVTFTNELKESGEGLVTFDPGEREAVASLADMEEKPIAIGEDAPSFSLATLDGKDVKLEDLRGQIVIIDFWATWCGPCIMGLPKLQEFAEYVAKEKLPVKVFAVNVWESERDPEKRKQLVREFWETRKFTMPTLIDPENAVVTSYGVSGIPAMFVIDQNGKVANVHVGFDPNIAQVLKEEVARLRQPAG